ncbi:MAG TPA: DUF3298 domain-containing protein [Gammaproteobacteria bacterium]|nr:DUF3298 domain-containing protein [Gammaproteobacteria bacterium]
MTTSSRPHIPAALRRRVIVEAGNRCAIHTCGSTTTEIHHIVPWEKCRSHDHKNLIALCPNCHARVHAGEIDRKSLALYKERLISLWDGKSTSAGNSHNEIHYSDWSVKDIKEETSEYIFDLQIPVFSASDLKELNVVLEGYALKNLHSLRAYELFSHRNSLDASMKNELSGSFTITYFTHSLVSIRFTMFSFSVGAAHPAHFTETMNYKRNRLAYLDFDDTFDLSSNHLELISKLSKKILLEKGGEDASVDLIELGASPDRDNFRKFNFTDYGMLFTFDEYQVGTYVDGEHSVIIPYEYLGDVLNEKILILL